MTLDAGRALLNYRLTEKIGVGGMGEVWRATDTTLGRDVAIKILPAEFASDAERLARFEREAKVLASLNHPNIAGIYGLHEANGVRFLAMELVPGEDLAERLKSGAIPFPEAMEIAGQIAEALEAAHDQGIIHRDLKPANVRITPDGKVKVLDFGLAKAIEAATTSSPGRDIGMSPTITSLGTVAGVILGTAAYMSPEQARGKPVDKRADVWGFGCVVFEMLSNTRPFEGETISDTLAAVLAKDPDWSKLPPTVPARVRELLQRCLEKDPKKRLRDIGDARIELSAIERGGESQGTRRSPRRAMLPLYLGLAVAAGGIGFAGWALTRPAPVATTAKLTRLGIARPPEAGLLGPGTFAIAPDGSAVVFSIATDTNAAHLWIRDLNNPIGHELEGTEKAFFPFWSDDSRSIAFFADGRLKRVSRSGGPVQTVCDAPNGRGGAWSSSGFIVFSPEPFGPLSKVDAGGGIPEPATALDAGRSEKSHRFPCFLQDGRHFTYGVLPEVQPSLQQISVASLDDPHGRPLVLSRSGARYAAPGYLIFSRGQALLAQRIDSKSFEMVGKVLPLAEVSQVEGGISGSPTVDCATDGTMVYDQRDARPTDILWADRDGRPLKNVIRHPGPVIWESLSHRGDRLAVIDAAGESAVLWVVDLISGTEARLSNPGRSLYTASWTPGDDRIVSFVWGRGELVSIDPRGGADRSLLPPGDRYLGPTSVAPDGTVVLDEAIVGNQSDIVYLPRGEGGKTRPYLATPANEGGSLVSPDGKFIAYSSDASGRREVYLDAFPEPRGAIRVSSEGAGAVAGWRDDGREIYFAPEGGRSFVACDVRTSPALEIGKPHVLFNVVPEDLLSIDIGPHGDRFLVIKAVGARASSLIAVHNWAAQLEKHE